MGWDRFAFPALSRSRSTASLVLLLFTFPVFAYSDARLLFANEVTSDAPIRFSRRGGFCRKGLIRGRLSGHRRRGKSRWIWIRQFTQASQIPVTGAVAFEGLGLIAFHCLPLLSKSILFGRARLPTVDKTLESQSGPRWHFILSVGWASSPT